jgi:hypothetical protein
MISESSMLLFISIILAGLGVFLKALDAITTTVDLASGGRELDPVTAFLITHIGEKVTLWGWVGLMAIFQTLMVHAVEVGTNWAIIFQWVIDAFFTWVVWHNSKTS